MNLNGVDRSQLQEFLPELRVSDLLSTRCLPVPLCPAVDPTIGCIDCVPAGSEYSNFTRSFECHQPSQHPTEHLGCIDGSVCDRAINPPVFPHRTKMDRECANRAAGSCINSKIYPRFEFHFLSLHHFRRFDHQFEFRLNPTVLHGMFPSTEIYVARINRV